MGIVSFPSVTSPKRTQFENSDCFALSYRIVKPQTGATLERKEVFENMPQCWLVNYSQAKFRYQGKMNTNAIIFQVAIYVDVEKMILIEQNYIVYP